ncbi:acetylxylan esterase [Eubacteriales bacterium OttesenSCG-928-N13]|nr:acetylxylan esterase [Eubacteriales bacterium OttesenSCG-928-N13]
MAWVDMPLEELKQYQGTNPKPTDFDAYWERSLAEMRSVQPNIELVPSDFKSPVAECFDLYFTGVRGARIHAKYLRPIGATEPAPGVVAFHGYSGNSGCWSDWLGMAASGFHVAAMDCRGQGGTSEDVGGVKGTTLNGHIIRGLSDHEDKLLFRDIFLDAAQLAAILMDMPGVDEKRVASTGGSQGGALALACASLEPRIARVCAMYPFLCDYQRVWEMDASLSAYQELKEYFRRHDPLHAREKQIFYRLGYIDVAQLVDRIRGQVLLATGLMDPICPPSSQFAAYNRITAPKNMLIYPDFGHENLPGCSDHFYQFMMGLRMCEREIV